MKALAILIAAAACGPQAPPTEPLPESEPYPRPVEASRKPKSRPAAPERTADRTPEPTPASEPEPTPGEPSGSVPDQFIAAHNKFRAKHCAPPLTWSKKLAEHAQKWANTLKDKGCVFGHSPGMKYGENLAAGTAGALDPTSTVQMWYDEIKLYKFPNGGFSMQTGHFTQLVWKSTKQVGCGHVSCKGNDIYVCSYDPAGNWEGQYKNQVFPASCKK